MPNQTFTNPMGVDQIVSDYTTWQDDSSRNIQYGRVERVYQANAAIPAGSATFYVAPTSTTPLRVAVMPLDATHAQLARFAGIAMNAASAAGDRVAICTEGHCKALMATANTVSTGSGATPGTQTAPAIGIQGTGPSATSNTAGQLAGTVPSASTPPGEMFGFFLGGQIGSTGLAPFVVRQH
jgi:hypothetical protein